VTRPAGDDAAMEGVDRHAALIQRTVHRLAQLQARRALSDMRRAAQANARARRRPPADIMGLLLVARDHFGDADTTRKLMRERAAQATQAVPQR
jgi:hypothetical protein